MKINFTKREYEALFDMINIAEWVLHSHEIEPVKDTYRKLYYRLVSYAKDFGLGDRVAFDEELGHDVLSEEEVTEGEWHQVIDAYEDEVFWDSLAYRMAQKKMLDDYGLEAINQMSRDERFILSLRAQSQYEDEFEANGLMRLNIDGELPPISPDMQQAQAIVEAARASREQQAADEQAGGEEDAADDTRA